MGLVYAADDGGGFCVVDQAWHFHTRNQELHDFVEGGDGAVLWSRPGFTRDEAEDLATQARLIARRLDENQLPYALAIRDAAAGEGGVIDLRTSLGLTCSSFLLVLFHAARVPLLDARSWDSDRSPQRVAADEAAQRTIVEALRRQDPAHANRVEGEVGCTRVRAEEVAAASTFALRPASFREVEPVGREVLGVLSSAWVPPP